ncbi:MAG: hypothetical protein M1821_009599 [Bathelium mastoideum]|nr:MAG: hypothetical protein M1821_009599 [Bathelium mastoideum]
MATAQKRSKTERLGTILEKILLEVIQYIKIDSLIVIALTIPPVAVLLVWGFHWRLLVNLLLFPLLVPAQVNAIYALSQKGVLTKNRHRHRNGNRKSLDERAIAAMKGMCKDSKRTPPEHAATQPGHRQAASQ